MLLRFVAWPIILYFLHHIQQSSDLKRLLHLAVLKGHPDFTLSVGLDRVDGMIGKVLIVIRKVLWNVFEDSEIAEDTLMSRGDGVVHFNFRLEGQSNTH